MEDDADRPEGAQAVQRDISLRDFCVELLCVERRGFVYRSVRTFLA